MFSHRGKRGFITTLLAAAIAIAPAAAFAELERVGPTMQDVGYPAWYQDTTGIVLDLCQLTSAAELSNGYCLLLPVDTTYPEVFPTVWADEHFYYASENVGDWAPAAGSTLQAPGDSDVRLVMALEATFAREIVVPGDQIVFARMRIRIDELPLTGTYTIYTPYHVFELDGVAGERLFHTEDFGIACGLGDFSCATQSVLGPFLVPSDEPGGAEIGPVTFNGRRYLASSNYSGPVTGSTLDDFDGPNGTKLDPHRFRIVAPNGEVMYDDTNFSVMGRLFEGEVAADVNADRASYTRTSETNFHVDVFATGFPSLDPRIPGDPIVPPVEPALQAYPAPCRGVESPTTGNEGPPWSAPIGVPAQNMENAGEAYFTQLVPNQLRDGVCIVHTNAKNAQGQTVPAFMPAPYGDKVSVSFANWDILTGTFDLEAHSSDVFQVPTLTLGAFGETEPTVLEDNGIRLQTIAPPHLARVFSSAGGSNSMQVTVVAGLPNEAPTAVDDIASTLAGEDVVIDVLANDDDPENDDLAITSFTAPQNGTAVIEGDDIRYTPALGFSGADAFTYTISDGLGGSATANVIVTVNGANGAPVANPDVVTTTVNTALDITVLANDTDPEDHDLTVTAVGIPANGTATFAANGIVTYTPGIGYVGTDTFTYTIDDGHGATAQGSVVVTVNSANQTPIATPDAQTALAGTLVTIPVLANDVDPDGDTLRISSITQAANGLVRIVGQDVTYEPVSSFFGADTFTYTVTDDKGGFATAVVTLTLDPGPQPPVANDDAGESVNGAAVTLNVLANDTDVNGDTLVITDVVQPANGSVTFTSNSLTFTPNAGFLGTATFSYTVSDGNGGTDSASVSVLSRATETLVVTSALHRRNEWRILGTSSVQGATITVHAGPTLGGAVIGTATVAAGGAWEVRTSTSGVPANTRVSVESSGGGTRLNFTVLVR